MITSVHYFASRVLANCTFAHSCLATWRLESVRYRESSYPVRCESEECWPSQSSALASHFSRNIFGKVRIDQGRLAIILLTPTPLSSLLQSPNGHLTLDIISGQSCPTLFANCVFHGSPAPSWKFWGLCHRTQTLGRWPISMHQGQI